MKSNNLHEVRIEDVTEIVFSGGTPATTNRNFWNGSIPWLSSGETRNKFITNTEKKITREAVENSSTKLAQKRDIIIASAGQGYTRGQTSLLLIDTFINQSLIALRANSNIILPEYLFYNLQNRYHELRGVSDGHSIRGSITTKLIKSLPIKIPKLEVQRQVTEILLSIDEKIELNNKIIAKQEELSNLVFKHWFIDFEFPNEQGQPYKSSGGKMVESELGQIPEGWGILSIDEISEKIIDHRGKTPKKLGGDWSKSGYPAISAKNIKQNKIVKEEEIRFLSQELYLKWMKEELEYGDLLMTSEAPLGEMYFVNKGERYCLSQRVFAIRVNKNYFAPSIFFYLLNQNKYKEMILNRASGTTVTGIRQSELRKVRLVVPAMYIQKGLEDIMDFSLAQQYNLRNQNRKLHKLRDILLPKLISGEIEVPIFEPEQV